MPPTSQRHAKRCEDCMLLHPERGLEKECSAFGRRENRDGDCSLHIAPDPNAITVEEHIRRVLEGKK